jgi:hypothetical protein
VQAFFHGETRCVSESLVPPRFVAMRCVHGDSYKSDKLRESLIACRISGLTAPRHVISAGER